ncbi:MAG: zinc-dependent dehydrogenase [Candidatus Theseobacter exili]|nr:zinc-dependent dehydrogenase [Candidatus Theseobacter exili]
MRAAVYYNNNDIRIEEKPKPKCKSDEILVKVIASGICGSDVMEWYRIKKAPLVLGHEITGEIVETGKNVVHLQPENRVFVSHHVPCNTCNYCLKGNHTVCDTLRSTNYYPGGFSEYIRVPSINIDRGTFILPDEVSYEEGVFIEPLACVVRSQIKAGFKAGSTVLILGSGISGMLHLMLAKAMGANKIITTDINEYRLNKAKEFGADAAINATESIPDIVRDLNNKHLADMVIICTGAPNAFNQALNSVERGGTIIYFAPAEPDIDLPFPAYDFWNKGITIMPSYANSPYDATVALNLIQSHRVPVSKLITHQLGLNQTDLGFKLVANANESLKVIIKPQE